LYQAGFPVPQPYLYCNNSSIIGTEFYVMNFIQGRIFRDPSLPQLKPFERSCSLFFFFFNFHSDQNEIELRFTRSSFRRLPVFTPSTGRKLDSRTLENQEITTNDRFEGFLLFVFLLFFFY
jgi:hypothetical protein